MGTSSNECEEASQLEQETPPIIGEKRPVHSSTNQQFVRIDSAHKAGAALFGRLPLPSSLAPAVYTSHKQASQPRHWRH